MESPMLAHLLVCSTLVAPTEPCQLADGRVAAINLRLLWDAVPEDVSRDFERRIASDAAIGEAMNRRQSRDELFTQTFDNVERDLQKRMADDAALAAAIERRLLPDDVLQRKLADLQSRLNATKELVIRARQRSEKLLRDVQEERSKVDEMLRQVRELKERVRKEQEEADRKPKPGLEP